MARIVLPKGAQRRFIEKIMEKGIAVRTIAHVSRVSERTVRDWRREKFTLDAAIAARLSKQYALPLGKHAVLEDGWHLSEAGVRGGRARVKKYGAPGTPSGRKKGGIRSQEVRRANPEYYRAHGCIVRKSWPKLVLSTPLAELVGILIGDGGMSDYQVAVSLDKVADAGYGEYVSNLMTEVFGERPCRHVTRNVVRLVVSGAGLIDRLEAVGLFRGNKVRHQIALPQWIFSRPSYRKACLRGLFDTDGGIYIHKKQSGLFAGWSFCNHSWPIIAGVSKILTLHGFPHSVARKGVEVRMYRFSDILRYMAVVGSSNPKNQRRIDRCRR